MYIIRLNAEDRTLSLRTIRNEIKLSSVGRRGLPGAQGPKGDKGDKGDQGPQGLPGQDGADGVVQSIVAGSNITVDDTDPANPVISSTGGGGGGAVDSVNGKTGVVVLNKSDIGLGNVDNTSDANKPVSTATQTALNGKENSFSKGNLVAGTNVTLSGTLTNRLVGSGNVTINAAGGVSSVEWGDINGTLSDQTDLQNALDDKADTSSLSTVATSGDYDDLTNKPSIPNSLDDLSGDSDDISEGSTNLFLTSSERTKLSNTSGTNTGDQTLSGLGGVPTTRTINGLDLSANRTLTQDNIGDGTTYKQYSQTEKSKLAGIEASADVTDAANVAAAGATMDADTSLAGNGYFLDEDDMASDSDTKVPSQQSVKAYVDNNKEIPALRISDATVVTSHAQRVANNLTYWVDGVMGFLDAGGGNIVALSPDGPLTTFTAHDPATGAVLANVADDVSIDDQIEPAPYAAGGPVFMSSKYGAGSGSMMVYHGEEHPNAPSGFPYWGFLGLAQVNGTTLTDIGRIVTPEVAPEDTEYSANSFSGSFVVKDGYVYTFFQDSPDGTWANATNLSVARTTWDEWVDAAENQVLPTFYKYHNGEWNSPGIGGAASDVLPGGNGYDKIYIGWMDITYVEKADAYLMVYSRVHYINPSLSQFGIESRWTKDFITYSEPTIIVPYSQDNDERLYLTVAPALDEPNFLKEHVKGDFVDVYYTVSTLANSGGDRWADLHLDRKRIEIMSPSHIADLAVLKTDTSTSGMDFVIDEDSMVSNSATLIPTQQSTKAYVDTTTAGIVKARNLGFNPFLNVASNTTTETNLHGGYTLVGGAIGTGYLSNLSVNGTLLNDSGSSCNYTIRIKIGSLTWQTYTFTMPTNANEVAWRIDVAAACIDFLGLRLVGAGTLNVGNPAGGTDTAVITQQTSIDPIDFTTSKQILATVQMSVANANTNCNAFSGYIDISNPV